MTTGGADEDDAHWLSEEDTKNLKEIFFNILVSVRLGGGETEARGGGAGPPCDVTCRVLPLRRPPHQIQGTEEAQKERRRQQALEDNYRFVWGGRDEPQPPGDSEDPDF